MNSKSVTRLPEVSIPVPIWKALKYSQNAFTMRLSSGVPKSLTGFTNFFQSHLLCYCLALCNQHFNPTHSSFLSAECSYRWTICQNSAAIGTGLTAILYTSDLKTSLNNIILGKGGCGMKYFSNVL